MTLAYIWRTLLCFWEITAGLAGVPDKEMGNFIVCRYQGNGFCEYWAGRIEAFIQPFTAWIRLDLQTAVLPAGCNEDFITENRPIWYHPSPKQWGAPQVETLGEHRPVVLQWCSFWHILLLSLSPFIKCPVKQFRDGEGDPGMSTSMWMLDVSPHSLCHICLVDHELR